MTRRGKKYKKSKEELDLARRYDFSEGVKLALECAYARFDESVDLAVRLGVDPRRADQMVRGTVVLPNGTGKSVRVLAFAKGEKEKEALEAGADYAGGDELITKIQGGWLDFDKTVATPDMMGAVGKIGNQVWQNRFSRGEVRHSPRSCWQGFVWPGQDYGKCRNIYGYHHAP